MGRDQVPVRDEAKKIITPLNAVTNDTPLSRVPKADEPRRSVWLPVILLAAPPLLSLVINLSYGSFLIDDAYITFRYAENLALGHGLVFNPGERVLGTTTPLWALLLAAARVLGFEIPSAARALGLVFCAAMIAVLELMALRRLGIFLAAGLGLLVALHPITAFTANSGLETALSMAVVFAALACSMEGWHTAAGLLGGLAVLVRPDGVAVAGVVIGLAIWRERTRAWRPVAAAAAVTLPWAIYSTLYYGSCLPQSIAAKQIIHAGSPLAVLAGVLLFFLGSRVELNAILFLSLSGMFMAGRQKNELVPVLAWMLVYLAGMVFSGIEPTFTWYFAPLVPGALLLALFGLGEAGKIMARLPGRAGSPWVAKAAVLTVIVLLGLGLTRMILPWRSLLATAGYQRSGDYLALGDWLRGRCRPGDAVLVGEVGVLSYVLIDQVIIDGAGINTLEVYNYRREDRERLIAGGVLNPHRDGSAEWVMKTIARFRPRYIVTYRIWLHIEEIMRDPALAKEYRRLDPGIPRLRDYVVLERMN